MIALTASITATAITIDTDTYFAFAKIRGMGRSSIFIMLSDEPCPSKGAPSGWKRAAYNYSSNWGDDPACWLATSRDIVRICPHGQYDTKISSNDYGGVSVSPCHEIRKTEFIDTATLPRRSNF